MEMLGGCRNNELIVLACVRSGKSSAQGPNRAIVWGIMIPVWPGPVPLADDPHSVA